MRWCRVEVEGQPSFGIVEGSEVALIDGPPYEAHQKTGRKVATAKFLPPVIPYNFYAAGINYRAHIEWAAQRLGMALKPPAQADIGYRSPNALIGSGADIVIPKDSPGPVHFEGELVAVVGRRAKDLTEANALSCISGYTLGNDLSERSFQKSDRTLWRAKNIDTFKPMGPVVVDGIDPMKQDITVRVNGKEASTYNTSGAIFSLQHYIARMSAYVTLWPGDVIWLGCDGPTLPALEPGDLVEVANDAIGVLANRVVKANSGPGPEFR
ncbi:MAG: fumarylacetoacetate hydrolase family protein [Betaproteobacteria bacterium]|nr:fumarylacetoacetate hydrolase family protein [Betaproteobacteria bacterium]